MNCKKCSELMSEYLDGCLEGSVLREFEAHIRECVRCAGALTDMQDMVASLSSLSGVASPVDCWKLVREEIYVQQAAVPLWRRIFARPMVAIPASAGAMIAAFVLLWPGAVEEPQTNYVSAPEYSQYISAHSRVQRQQTFVDPDVAFISAELEKVSVSSVSSDR